MHFHTEIIMPPTDDVASAVAKVMKPFDENQEGEGADRRHAFWDFYVIGGRWAGTKLLAKYDPEKIEAFEAWLQDSKVTVSGFSAGKQSISPSDQIPMVDAKWSEMFPDAAGKCPLFAHSNDQYGRQGVESGTIDGDICKLVEVPARLTCSRIIFAGPDYKGEGVEATFMLSEDAWNGVNHMPVTWDGTVSAGLKSMREHIARYRDEYRARIDPQDDWLAVTVDYHS